MRAFSLSSPAFRHDDAIPAKYTCDGSDVSPPLVPENPPAGTKSLALVVDDPDAPAGTWTHWVVWNLPPDLKGIAENRLPEGAVQGTNDFRKRGWGGPCPPSGTHRYFFQLYALDTALPLTAAATKPQLEQAMQGHVLGKAELVGRYRRK
jgi:Raf kinase inhibitor-like YbhB/YbcL family protein